jgi:hypothetical protein
MELNRYGLAVRIASHDAGEIDVRSNTDIHV